MTFALPKMKGAADAAKAAAAVLDAVASGDLTPTEGAHVMALIETYRRTLETTELEARVAALALWKGQGMTLGKRLKWLEAKVPSAEAPLKAAAFAAWCGALERVSDMPEGQERDAQWAILAEASGGAINGNVAR